VPFVEQPLREQVQNLLRLQKQSIESSNRGGIFEAELIGDLFEGKIEGSFTQAAVAPCTGDGVELASRSGFPQSRDQGLLVRKFLDSTGNGGPSQLLGRG